MWLYAKSPPLSSPDTELLRLRTDGTRSQMLANRQRVGFRRRRTSAALSGRAVIRLPAEQLSGLAIYEVKLGTGGAKHALKLVFGRFVVN